MHADLMREKKTQSSVKDWFNQIVHIDEQEQNFKEQAETSKIPKVLFEVDTATSKTTDGVLWRGEYKQ